MLTVDHLNGVLIDDTPNQDQRQQNWPFKIHWKVFALELNRYSLASADTNRFFFFCWKKAFVRARVRVVGSDSSSSHCLHWKPCLITQNYDVQISLFAQHFIHGGEIRTTCLFCFEVKKKRAKHGRGGSSERAWNEIYADNTDKSTNQQMQCNAQGIYLFVIFVMCFVVCTLRADNVQMPQTGVPLECVWVRRFFISFFLLLLLLFNSTFLGKNVRYYHFCMLAEKQWFQFPK